LALRLYADECVDARIVAGLRRRGIDVFTAGDAGLLGRPDEIQLDKARDLGRVILSGDQDFLHLTHRRAGEGIAFPGLIFIQPKSAVGEVIRAVALLAELLAPEDIAGWIEWVP
jgi:hypothetical protein